jgi:hypothetical protein
LLVSSFSFLLFALLLLRVAHWFLYVLHNSFFNFNPAKLNLWALLPLFSSALVFQLYSVLSSWALPAVSLFFLSLGIPSSYSSLLSFTSFLDLVCW